MTQTQTQTAAELNAATAKSVAARTAAIAAAPAKPAKPVSKATPAKAAAPAKGTKKALTPRERAARPVTATIASYVEWLNKTVFDGKMTDKDKKVAGISITLYGNYQVSPERKAARGY